MNEIDELTPEQLANAQAVSIMPTCMFVYHDESGNVPAISNEKNDSLLYVEIPESKLELVPTFIVLVYGGYGK